MKLDERQMPRFLEVQLWNWRNFPHVHVALQHRVFIVGPNASGKSNLLDVFRFLRDVASPGGGLQHAVERRGGVKALRCLAARAESRIGIRVWLSDRDSRATWGYDLSLDRDSHQRPIVSYEQVWLWRAADGSDGTPVLRRPNVEDERDPERLTQTYLEQVSVNKDFRKIADFFASVRYLHIVPQLVREPERFARDPDRSIGHQRDPYGGDFLEQVARTPERTRMRRLELIRSALSIAVPQLKELKLDRDNRGTPHLKGRYTHWRPRGAWQGEDSFSDGTLRLMGLLWAVMDGTGPLLLEEPELSLHPEVVRCIPQMLARAQKRSGRQIILSTHSHDLLLDEGIGLDEVLLVQPQDEGSSVQPAGSIQEAKLLLEGGLSMADLVMSHTRPENTDQLARFGK